MKRVVLSNIALKGLVIVLAVIESHQECSTTTVYECLSYNLYGHRTCRTNLEICTNISDTDVIPYRVTFDAIKITRSNITTLNAAMFSRVNPRYVSVSRSGVKRIEGNTFRMNDKFLQMIEVIFNDISEIHANTFSDLPALKTLNISNNRIEHINAGALKGSPVETLDVSSNRIENIINITQSATNVLNLYLHNNAVSRLLNGTFNSPRLRHLALQYNQIELIENGAFAPLTSLNYLDLGGNRLYKINSGVLPSEALQPLSKLETLKLYQNSLRTIGSNSLRNAEHHDISNNNYSSDFFNNLYKITQLDVSNNNLTSIAINSFKHLTNLRMLNLSINSISELLPGTFSKLHSLQILDLQRNQLKTLPTGLLQHNENLYKLYISGNLLEELNQNVLSYRPQLNVISLDDNKWSCESLSNIIHMLKLLRPVLEIQEGAHHSTPNINGNSCNLNSTVQNGNISVEAILQENLQVLKKLNEKMAETELGNEQIINLLSLLHTTSNVSSQNDKAEKNSNSTLELGKENVKSILSEIRDSLTRGDQVNARLVGDHPSIAPINDRSYEKSERTYSVLVMLLCVQIIFVLFIVGAFVYHVKFRSNITRDSEGTLLQDFEL